MASQAKANYPRNGLSKANRFALYISLIALLTSGLIWLIMHYFVRVRTEFGVLSHHYLEHKMLVIHGTFAYGFIFVFGTIWNSHVKKWFNAGKKNFKSGVLIVSIIFLLMITGIMLYYPFCDYAQDITSIIHCIAGALLLLIFSLHITSKNLKQKIKLVSNLARNIKWYCRKSTSKTQRNPSK